MARGGKIKDIVGEKRGYLTVLSFDRLENHVTWWKCKCICGKEVTLRKNNLVPVGRTNSCGCKRKELLSKTHIKHNLIHTKEYRTWASIKSRCYNPKTINYQYYGERGIRICEEWKNNFINFFEYIGKAPTPEHSIDRIDPEGNYEPGNVRWATSFEQRHNQRRSAIIKL